MNIPDYEIAFRLLLACICGGFVGIEREKTDKPAGFRTHVLVSLGAALMTIISMYGFESFTSINKDPARIAAQIITGIGFLGAGTIMREGFSVRGLTTAASIWVVAGIGMAVGTGMYFSAIVSTVLMFIILDGVIEKYFFPSRERIRITISGEENKIRAIGEVLDKFGILIQHVAVLPMNDLINIRVEFRLRVPKTSNILEAIREVENLNGINLVERLPKG
ncbi:MAG TPA: MgtC/SapB family protein [Candidatus Deferrimicrobium sp.]|nr:MgtC/SapB family protein [Candidatus Deferrimicrobium sp.]